MSVVADVVVISAEKLEELIRRAVRAELAGLESGPATAAPLIDKKECARALGVSSATLDRLVAAGRVPCVCVGDHRRFALDQVVAALATSPASVPASKPQALPGVRCLSRPRRTGT
jgi:excisionase family DNA binding protein